jgi:hydroxymethylpyrimidine/phosphomethylpyrimidine kinase
MLATRALVHTVAAAIRMHQLTRYVLDPVMVASSGDRLLEEDATDAVLRELMPLALLVTPNLEEASILAGFTVDDATSMRRAAHVLVDAGARAALIKGGHLRGSEVLDVLYDGMELHTYRHARLDTRSTHGTGCTLSAAVTAGLARGDDLVSAVERALAFVHRAMASAPNLGRGNGPLNHFVPAPQPLRADR